MNAQFVGFGRRFVAWFLDGVIIWVVNMFIAVILVGSVSLVPGGKNASDASAVMLGILSYVVLPLGYWVFLQSKMGQTLGKKALGIKVVDQAGKTPSMMTFFLREIIGKIVSAIILLIGYLMVLWDGKKQALHDKIASTYVVRV